jgi:hypothetical protein
MRAHTIRLSVVAWLLLGFAVTLAAMRVQGGPLLSQHVFAFLLMLAAAAGLAALGSTGWEGEVAGGARPVAGGLRTFACMFVGAGFAGAAGRGLTGEDGSGLGFACLAIGIAVALLSISVDRRAWLAEPLDATSKG